MHICKIAQIDRHPYLRIYVFGEIEIIHVFLTRSLLFHPVKGASKKVNRQHGNKKEPANLEDSRPKVEYSIVFDDPAIPCTCSALKGRKPAAARQGKKYYSRNKLHQFQNAGDPQNPQNLDDADNAAVTRCAAHCCTRLAFLGASPAHVIITLAAARCL
jgi:hypothetical protein